MATAWPSLTADMVLSGEGAGEIGSEPQTLSEHLWDRDRVIEQAGTSFLVSGSTASGSLVTVQSTQILIPDIVIAGKVIRLYVWGSNTSSNGSYRIKIGATNGTTATITTAGPYESVLTAPDDTWSATEQTLELQAAAGAGTTTLAGIHMLMNLRFGD